MLMRIIVFSICVFLFPYAIAFGQEIGGSCSGQMFHYETSFLSKRSPAPYRCSPSTEVPLYKRYDAVEVVLLPKPDFNGITVEQSIRARRSRRNFGTDPLSRRQLSQLLFAAQGITERNGTYSLRSVPSAGALYPLEVYVVVFSVEGLSRGIYHYAVAPHAVELLTEGNFKDELVAAGLGQMFLSDAQAVFIITARFERTSFKYGERAWRYVYMEAGHVSQNLYLQSTSLGLSTVSVAAFRDDMLNALLGIDGKRESALYIQPVGTRAN